MHTPYALAKPTAILVVDGKKLINKSFEDAAMGIIGFYVNSTSDDALKNAAADLAVLCESNAEQTTTIPIIIDYLADIPCIANAKALAQLVCSLFAGRSMKPGENSVWTPSRTASLHHSGNMLRLRQQATSALREFMMSLSQQPHPIPKESLPELPSSFWAKILFYQHLTEIFHAITRNPIMIPSFIRIHQVRRIFGRTKMPGCFSAASKKRRLAV